MIKYCVFIAVIIGSIVTMSVVLILRRQTPSLAVDTNNIEMGMDQSENEIETEKIVFQRWIIKH